MADLSGAMTSMHPISSTERGDRPFRANLAQKYTVARRRRSGTAEDQRLNRHAAALQTQHPFDALA
jgi:hypothetical protein